MAIHYPPTQNGLQKTLDANLLTGVTASATLNNVTGIQNKKGIMVIDRVDGNNNLTPNKREYISFDGTSGSTVVTLGRGLAGSTDQDHAVGAIVEFVNDVVQQQAIIDYIEALNTTVTALPTASSTTTFTNKRINPRIVTAASYTTDTGTSLDVSTCDEFDVTAQAGALKLNNPGGTPVNGQKLIVRIKDDGTARALTYDTQFRAIDNPLPSITILSKTLYMEFIYNLTDTKWDLIKLNQEDGTPWKSWIPTWSGGVSAIGNATVVATYSQVGKTVNCYIRVDFGNTTSFTAGALTFSLPVTARVFGQYVGQVYLEDYASAGYVGFIQLASATTVNLIAIATAAAYGSNLTATNLIPFTWANQDYFNGSFTYEAA